LRSTTGISAQLMLGDFNAYTEEDPMDVLRAAGLYRLLAPGAYSYVYEGAFGSLDHAWATDAMAQGITGASMWHINSDEPAAFNYADANLGRYQPNAFRCSDHDPVLVGIAEELLPVRITEEQHASTVLFQQEGALGKWSCTSCIAGKQSLRLHDARGAELFIRYSSGGAAFMEDLSGLSSGIYVWRLVTTCGTSVAGRFAIP
jgi:hypothetical protein